MNPTQPQSMPTVLSTDEAARFLGISASALNADRRLQHLKVPYYRIGKRVVYRIADLEAWLLEHRADATNGGAP